MNSFYTSTTMIKSRRLTIAIELRQAFHANYANANRTGDPESLFNLSALIFIPSLRRARGIPPSTLPCGNGITHGNG